MQTVYALRSIGMPEGTFSMHERHRCELGCFIGDAVLGDLNTDLNTELNTESITGLNAERHRKNDVENDGGVTVKYV